MYLTHNECFLGFQFLQILLIHSHHHHHFVKCKQLLYQTVFILSTLTILIALVQFSSRPQHPNTTQEQVIQQLNYSNKITEQQSHMCDSLMTWGKKVNSLKLPI